MDQARDVMPGRLVIRLGNSASAATPADVGANVGSEAKLEAVRFAIDMLTPPETITSGGASGTAAAARRFPTEPITPRRRLPIAASSEADKFLSAGFRILGSIGSAAITVDSAASAPSAFAKLAFAEEFETSDASSKLLSSSMELTMAVTSARDGGGGAGGGRQGGALGGGGDGGGGVGGGGEGGGGVESN